MTAFDTSVIGSSGGTAVTSQATAALTTAGAGELLIASLHTPVAVTSISVSGGGLTWTLLRSDHNTTSSDAYVSIYYAYAPSAFSGAVTFSWTGSAKAIVTAAAFTNAGQSPGANHSSQGASVTATDVVTTTRAGSLVIGFYTANGSQAYTSPSGQTNSQSGANSGGASSTQCRGVATRQNSTTTNSGTAVTMGGTSDVASSSHWIYDAVEIKNNTSPTTALNTPADTVIGVSTTPTFNFTGTDAEGDNYEVEFQADTANTFDGSTISTITSYYFDAHLNTTPGIPTDPNSAFSNDAFGFDGLTTDAANETVSGSTSSNYLYGKGTTAPSGNTNTITQVRARLYSSAHSTKTAWADIYTASLAQDLGTITNTQTTAGWGSYITLTTPTGGWDWSKLAALETKYYSDDTDGGFGGAQYYRLEIEVTYQILGPLLDKLSTTDAGFTAGHPFTSGVATNFTVQAGDALTANTTYYWRVRAIDPLGSNTYGAWATTQSFTTASGVVSNSQFFDFFPVLLFVSLLSLLWSVTGHMI